MSFPGLIVHFFLSLNNTSLRGCTTVCSSTYLLMDIFFSTCIKNWHTSLYKFKAYSMTVLIDVYCEMIATVGSAKIHLPIHRFLISWIMLWVLHKALEDSCIFSWAVLILMLLNRIVTVSLFFFTFFFFFFLLEYT